jgi:hypothetical protein
MRIECKLLEANKASSIQKAVSKAPNGNACPPQIKKIKRMKQLFFITSSIDSMVKYK